MWSGNHAAKGGLQGSERPRVLVAESGVSRGLGQVRVTQSNMTSNMSDIFRSFATPGSARACWHRSMTLRTCRNLSSASGPRNFDPRTELREVSHLNYCGSSDRMPLTAGATLKTRAHVFRRFFNDGENSAVAADR